MQIEISVGYIAIWENLNPKMHFVAKQSLEEMRYLKPKVEKMRSEIKCGRPNMALHLNE